MVKIKLTRLKDIVLVNKYRSTKDIPNYSIITEKRFPKIKTDDNKLYGTNKNHKYY